MGIIGFLKRALPFFATFALGLLIASFFIDLKGPSFRSGKFKKCREASRLRAENEQLRNETLRLRNELEMLRSDEMRMRHPGHEWRPKLQELELMVPPPPVAPMTKAAPVEPRAVR